MIESGYSRTAAKKPYRVMNTPAFASALVTENAPIIEGMQMFVNKIKNALASKDLVQEESKVLTYMLDTFIKNYQLLSGGATERQVFVLPSQVMDRNAIEPSKDEPKKELSASNDGSTEPQK